MENGERNAGFADRALACIVPFTNFIFSFTVATHGGEFDDMADAGDFCGFGEIFFVNAGLWTEGERKNAVYSANGIFQRRWVFKIAADDFDARIELGSHRVASHGADFSS